MNITTLLTLGGAALLLFKSNSGSNNTPESDEDAQKAAQSAYDNANESGVDLGADEMNLEGEEDGYYYPNAEKSDLKVYGLLRIGNMAGVLNRAALTVYITNESESTSYLLRKVGADVYLLNEKVGFKKDQEKEINVSIAPGQTVPIQFANTECYMKDKAHRERIRKEITTKCGKKLVTSCPKVDLGNLADIDVNLEWQPRNGAGTPVKARYTNKPCEVRYCGEAFVG